MKLRNLILAVMAGAALLTGCEKEVDLGPAKLVVNPTEVAFTDAQIASQDITLTATRDWAVTGLPDWIALSKETGPANPGDQTITLSVTENKGNNRNATLTFSIGFERATLAVSQAGPEGEVDNGDGTKKKPFNVAGVLEYLEGLGGDVTSPKNVYVMGKISAISEEFTTQYGNGSFTISDDGETSSPQFTAYRVMYLGNAKFASGDTQISVGDDVILYGKVVNYKGNTPETAQKEAFLYSLNGVNKGGDEGGEGGESGEAKGTGTLEDPFNVAAAIAKAVEVGETATETEYYIKGKVAEVKEQFSAQYGNGTFTMVDEGFDAVFTAYRIKFLENKAWVAGNSTLNAGDEVVVCAKIMNFKGNTPETSGGYLYSLNGKTVDEGGGETPGTEETAKGTGTEADPYNPLAAKNVASALAPNAKTETDVYVKGIISSVKYTFSAQYGTATFNISEDGTVNGTQFTCYSVYYYDNKPWEEGNDQVAVGKEVLICGKLVNFQYEGSSDTTPETSSKEAWIVSMKDAGDTPGGGDTPAGNAIVIDFSTKGYENGTQYATTEQDGITVKFGDGANDGKYYTTGTGMRIYGGGYVQVSAEKDIIGIVYTFDTAVTNEGAGAYAYPNDAFPGNVDSGTYDQASFTWTGSAKSVKMTRGTGSGHWRLQKVAVYFEGSGDEPGGGDQPGGGDEPEEPKLPVNDGLSEATAFTMEDACYVAKNSTEDTEYYVKGVLGRDFEIRDGLASFELSDGTTTEKLTVLRAKCFAGALWDGTEPVGWLDEVILKGKVSTLSGSLPTLKEAVLIRWNGKSSFKYENDLSKIIALADDSEVMMEGLVSGVTSDSFIVTDGTNNVYVYNPATKAAVGDAVQVDGKKSSYNGIPQVAAGAAVAVVSSNNPVVYPDAADITAGFDSYPASATTSTYVSYYGVLAKSGNYYNVTVDGAATYTGSITKPVDALGLADMDGKMVHLTGYFLGVSSSKYLNLLCVAAEAVPSTIAEIVAQIPESATGSSSAVDYEAYLKGAVVSYVNGNTVYLEDASAAIMYYKADHGLVAGDVVKGKVSGKGYNFNKLPEIIGLGEAFTKATGGTIPETAITVAALLENFNANISRRVKLSGVTVTDAIADGDRNGKIKQGESELAVYASLKNSGLVLTANATGDLIAFPAVYNETQQLSFWDNSFFTATSGGDTPDPGTGGGDNPDPGTGGGDNPDPGTGGGETGGGDTGGGDTGSSASYVKVTAAPESWAGTYLLVTETANKVFNGFTTSGTIYGTAIDVTISEGTIASSTAIDACKLVIAAATVTDGAYTIKLGDSFLNWTSGNSLTGVAEESANANWNIVYNTEKNCVTITNAADATRNIKWNNNSPRFATYTSAQTEVQLYKLAE